MKIRIDAGIALIGAMLLGANVSYAAAPGASAQVSKESLQFLEESLEKLRKDHPVIFAAGCTVRDDRYVDNDSQYITYWAGDGGETLLVRDGAVFQVSVFSWQAAAKRFSLEAQGGIWSSNLAWDVFDYFSAAEYQMIPDADADALLALPDRQICKFEHQNLDAYTKKKP